MLRRLSSETPLVLAAPAAGTALPTAALEGLAMRVLVEAEPTPAAREAGVKAFVGRSVVRLVDGDRVIADPAEQEKVILGKLAFVIAERLPKLVELGILEPAAAPARLR
jgi:hypothetical protein